MDQKLLREREALCTQENPPRCTAECPVHVDVRGMIAALLKGNTGAAFKLYSKSVPFPGIISRICEQPCGGTCLRRKIDHPVSIRELERFIAASSGASSARVIAAPRKDQRVAVVGSGLGGLMAARALTLKGYRVTVFEKSGKLGGRIRSIPESTLPDAVIEADFAHLHTMPLEFRLNTEVGMTGAVSIQSLQQEFSAIYLDVGLETLAQLAPELAIDEQGALQVNPISLETSCPGVFAGGSLLGGRQSHKPIASVSDGRIAANSIDRLLQNVSLTADRSNEGSIQTHLYTNIEGEKQLKPIRAENPETGYTAEEAGLEAERCLQCECLECVKSCVYLAHYKGYPKKYFREIYNNLSIVMGIHHAETIENIELFEKLVKSIEKQEKAWLITGIGTGDHNHGLRQQCLIRPKGEMTGRFECSQDFFLRMISGPAKLSIYSEVLEDQRVFIEPIHQGGTLFIFGAGHVSQKIAPIAETVGFRTVILDDRPEFANADRFTDSKILLVESLENPLPDLPLDKDSYLVIVTRGHLHDKWILEQILKKPVAYIGMIGSRHKRDLIYKNLIEEGGFTAKDMLTVHCPVGVDILAESPEEIAISIVAELIRVRGEKSNAQA